MTRLTTVALGFLLCVGCGDNSLPPVVPNGGSGGVGGDASMPDGDLPDGDLPDGGDAGVIGDVCAEHLSGISCDVEELVSMSEWGQSSPFPPRFCARFGTGDVKCWSNRPGLVAGTDNPVPGTEPLRGEEMPFVALTSSALHIDARDQLCAWLENNAMQCVMTGWDGPYSQTIVYDSLVPITGIGAGAASGDSWVLFGQSTVARWRRPQLGSLPVSSPVQLGFTPTQIVADLVGVNGDRFETSCALSMEGDVYCWGDNAHGTLGLGDTLTRSATQAERVPLDEPALQIATQQQRVCAVLESGALKCWGTAGFGLGQGVMYEDNDVGDEPGELEALGAIDLGRGRTAVQVTMHRDVTCVVLDNGALKCFGSNYGGVLGQGALQDDLATADDDVPPIDLGAGRRVLQVAVAGTGFTASEACALLDDHSVKCWGGFQDSDDPMGDDLPRIDFGSFTRAEVEGFPPMVAVLEPLASMVPEEAITGDVVRVTCSVTEDPRTGDGVNPDSVVVQVVDPTRPTEVLLEAPAQLLEGDTYVAAVHGLSALATGAYQLQCAAADQAETPRTGRGGVAILYDGGPNITIVSPASDGVIVGQLNPLTIALTALPGALGLDDDEAEIDAMEVTLAGVEIAVTEGTMAGSYNATVDLLSSAFEPPPSGSVALTVRATNLRGIERIVTRYFMVDATGPTISATGTVVDGALVRGSQTLQVTVEDSGAGVAANSVRAYVGGDATPIVLVRAGAYFEGDVDTSQYPPTTTQLPILLVAEDTVGNASDLPLTLRIDNAPPTLSLDPPPIREAKVGTTGLLICSEPFDPVGDDSVSDQMIAPEGAEFRARIEDQNPLAGSGVVATVSGVNPASVAVYMLTDITRPLLIDTDGDGVCDNLNDEVTLLRRDLERAAASGNSYFPPDIANDGLEPVWDPDVCTHGTEMTPPPRRCASTSPLTRIIKASHPGTTAVDAIWGLAAVDSLNCAGRAWDWRQEVPNGGPVCAAVRASDALGNVGVSPALRLCLQRTAGTPYDCSANNQWRTHNCMSGTYMGQTVTCTPPPDFEAGLVRADAY